MAKNSAMQRLGSGLLSVAAAGGVLCILFVLLAVFFDVTLIMFKTGSMSPSIPAGSLAIVREIPADRVAVGDVVTVDRPDALPITHRVVDVVPAGGGVTTLTLRGDANATNDPAPYLVTNVRLVMFAVPGLAYAVSAVSNPFALGAITVGAAGIVTWAFWPRAERAPLLVRGPGHRRSAARHAGVVGGAIAAVLGAGLALAPTGAARAAEVEQVVAGDIITLVSISDPSSMADLQPGVPVPWQIGVSAHPAEPGVVTFTLSGSGALVTDARGLWISVDACSARWVGDTCAGTRRTIAASAPASAVLASPLALGAMRTSDELWLMISAEIPTAPVMRAGTATLALTASGVGDTVVAGTTPASLARTGADLSGPVRLACGAVLVGLVLSLIARLGRRRASA